MEINAYVCSPSSREDRTFLFCFVLFCFVFLTFLLYSYFLGTVIFIERLSLLVSNRYQRLAVYESLCYFLGVDKRILVWDLAERTLLTELKGHSDTVYSLSFSRDGNLLASGLWRFFSKYSHLLFSNAGQRHKTRENCRLHSLGQQPCKFTAAKESVHITKEFNSHRIGLVHQHGRRFIVWYTNVAAVTWCENALLL